MVWASHLLVLGGIVAGAAPDEERLTLLRNAQRSCEGRYLEGELTVRLRWGQTGKVTIHNYAEARVIWSGEKSWSEVVRRGVRGRDQPPEGEPFEHQQWIVDDVKAIQYVPHSRRVFITRNATEEPPLEARLAPADCWFGRWGGKGTSWVQLLDPRMITLVDNSKIRYAIRELPNRQLEVARRDDNLKSEARLVFALRDDGNVVKYDLRMPSSRYTRRGRCDWVRDAQGRCYLARREEEFEQETEHGRAAVYTIYETTHFNPDLHADPKLFRLESLKLPIGTQVEDSGTGRRWRTGDQPIDGVAERLGSLAERMRMRGFASRGR